MSAMVHPKAVLYSFKTHKSFSSSMTVKSEAMITGSVSDSPKKAYFKCSGDGLSSSFGGFSTEGKIGALGVPSG
ncbi:unnamed protein product [Prunus armeniaca]